MPSSPPTLPALSTACTTLPDARTCIAVLWPDEDCFYPRNVDSVSADGTRHILHDDGDRQSLNVRNETWFYCSASQPRPLSSPSDTHNGHKMSSELSAVLTSMLRDLGNRPFMLHQEQGFPSSDIHTYFEAEESSLSKQLLRLLLFTLCRITPTS